MLLTVYFCPSLSKQKPLVFVKIYTTTNLTVKKHFYNANERRMSNTVTTLEDEGASEFIYAPQRCGQIVWKSVTRKMLMFCPCDNYTLFRLRNLKTFVQ